MDYLGRSALASSVNLQNISEDLIPSLDDTYNIGDGTHRWHTAFINTLQTNTIHGLSDPILQTDGANKNYVDSAKGKGFAIWTNVSDGWVSVSPNITVPIGVAWSTPTAFLYTPTSTANSYQIQYPLGVSFSCVAPNAMQISFQKSGLFKFTLNTNVVVYSGTTYQARFYLQRNGSTVDQSYGNPVAPLPLNTAAPPFAFTQSCVCQCNYGDIFQYVVQISNIASVPISQVTNIGHAGFQLSVEQC